MKSPIFVVGSARSGTVFVGQVLKRHKNVHCLIERPEVFDYATYIAQNKSIKKDKEHVRKELLRRYKKAWNRSLFSCRSCSTVCRESGRVSSFPWSNCHLHKKIRRFADKTHQHVLNVRSVLDAFPDAQFIHVIRDGRDVVSSMLRHEGVLSWFYDGYIDENSEWPNKWFGVENVDHYREWREWSTARKCAQRWKTWVQEGLSVSAEVEADQWIDVYYESLVNGPYLEGERICSFLGLGFDKRIVSHVRASSVGKWKERLNKDQIKDIDGVVTPVLDSIDYYRYNIVA